MGSLCGPSAGSEQQTSCLIDTEHRPNNRVADWSTASTCEQAALPSLGLHGSKPDSWAGPELQPATKGMLHSHRQHLGESHKAGQAEAGTSLRVGHHHVHGRLHSVSTSGSGPMLHLQLQVAVGAAIHACCTAGLAHVAGSGCTAGWSRLQVAQPCTFTRHLHCAAAGQNRSPAAEIKPCACLLREAGPPALQLEELLLDGAGSSKHSPHTKPCFSEGGCCRYTAAASPAADLDSTAHSRASPGALLPWLLSHA